MDSIRAPLIVSVLIVAGMAAVSAWVWPMIPDGARVAVHVRMIPNGFELAYRGYEAKAFVYTEREARYARLMPAKKLSDSEKAVRSPMPGMLSTRSRRAARSSN